MEIFSANNKNGISFEKLCSSIPKLLGSRSSIQNILNEGLDKKSKSLQDHCKKPKRRMPALDRLPGVLLYKKQGGDS